MLRICVSPGEEVRFYSQWDVKSWQLFNWKGTDRFHFKVKSGCCMEHRQQEKTEEAAGRRVRRQRSSPGEMWRRAGRGGGDGEGKEETDCSMLRRRMIPGYTTCAEKGVLYRDGENHGRNGLRTCQEGQSMQNQKTCLAACSLRYSESSLNVVKSLDDEAKWRITKPILPQAG